MPDNVQLEIQINAMKNRGTIPHLYEPPLPSLGWFRPGCRFCSFGPGAYQHSKYFVLDYLRWELKQP